ncbi:phosphatidylglycerophosphatase and protein-tyrosine phosphatase 1-like [Lingula anatina]|uniref:Phosphatidylglycerophosphatase and protein-tyrosine phosphatase 1-like n=1 Tax=Lingula anatina TaxID=7574 RepID=A0A1S3J170_LINAN|nr:phosphatidylglycerophosphatase and protein-tyrosine phosphatase 1-like [Lingula anatina]|eukprot:XP_013404192.1 phosphatidylglycerophosphatase and protein-tyrosine phosphatase 1-like [Lingula anatina]
MRTGWQKLGVEQLRLSTTDLTPPSVQDLTKGVNFILDAPEGSVYVHCKAGRSRSATLVACYLMKVHNWSPEEAVSFIKDKRPHVMILPSHYEVLRTFQQTLSD